MNKKALVVGLLFGVPFGALMWLAYSDEPAVAATTGLVSGVAVTGAVASYAAWSARRWATWVKRTTAKYESEGLVHCGRASMPRPPMRAVEGLLVLTTQRLVFEPYGLNLLAKRSEMPTSAIAGVRPGVGLQRNALTLFTRDKRSLEIYVPHSAEWLSKLPGVRS